MKFSVEVWKKIEPIYEKTINQPFIVELASGELHIEKFLYYISQDAIYLPEYSRVLAVAAAKAEAEDRQFFLEVSIGALSCETELHQEYAKRYSLKTPQELSPACFSYVNYLMSLGQTSSCAVLSAALLPCAWIYAEVGLELSKRAAPNNKYVDWIKAYSDPEFMNIAMKLKDITDRLAENVAPAERVAMEKAFIMSSRLEYMFWNDSYNLAKWVI